MQLGLILGYHIQLTLVLLLSVFLDLIWLVMLILVLIRVLHSQIQIIQLNSYVLITENDNNNLLANSDVVTFTANFSETMTPSPTITIKENDQPVTFHISDYSSNQIGINVQNRRFDQLT